MHSTAVFCILVKPVEKGFLFVCLFLKGARNLDNDCSLLQYKTEGLPWSLPPVLSPALGSHNSFKGCTWHCLLFKKGEVTTYRPPETENMVS